MTGPKNVGGRLLRWVGAGRRIIADRLRRKRLTRRNPYVQFFENGAHWLKEPTIKIGTEPIWYASGEPVGGVKLESTFFKKGGLPIFDKFSGRFSDANFGSFVINVEIS